MLSEAQQAKKNELLKQTYNRRSSFELAEGYLRYEALRKLNVPQFRYLLLTHIACDKPFDEMVDEIVLENAK